jgi:hypothetical protein
MIPPDTLDSYMANVAFGESITNATNTDTPPTEVEYRPIFRGNTFATNAPRGRIAEQPKRCAIQ